MNEDRIQELVIQLNQLHDEHQVIWEEQILLEWDEPEKENLEIQLVSLEIEIGKLEEELELLR